MVCDLNKALLYCGSEGTISGGRPSRKLLHLVDAVEAGQGEGPLGPEPVRAGIAGCSGDPVLLDAVCARLCGIDHERVPYMVRASEVRSLPFTSLGRDEARILVDGIPAALDRLEPRVRLGLPRAWAGTAEFGGGG
jgi:hypothetical protein